MTEKLNWKQMFFHRPVSRSKTGGENDSIHFAIIEASRKSILDNGTRISRLASGDGEAGIIKSRRRFKLVTEHKPIEEFMNKKDSGTPMIRRRFERFNRFDFSIHYKPGIR